MNIYSYYKISGQTASSPPPGENPLFIGWEFDDNLLSVSGEPEETWLPNGSTSINYVNAAPSNLAKAVSVGGFHKRLFAQGNWVQSLSNLGWDNDWTILLWNDSSTGSNINLSYYERGFPSGKIWSFSIISNNSSSQGFVQFDPSPFILAQSHQGANNLGRLCWVTHDRNLDDPIASSYQMLIGVNDSSTLRTFTGNVTYSESPSNPTLVLTGGFNFRCAQLAIFKRAMSEQEITDLWNNGDGSTLS